MTERGKRIARCGMEFLVVCAVAILPTTLPGQQRFELHTSFRVKYIAQGTVYLDAGRNAGLTPGMKLTIKRPDPQTAGGFATIAEIQVVGVGSASAVCEVKGLAASDNSIQVGDTAYLSSQDEQALQADQGAMGSRKYPQVVTFTEGDPLEEEQRAYVVPHPPLPEINRMRGRFGVDYTAIQSLNGVPSTFQMGMVLRADMTRIGGTYWNFTGFYRGRLQSTPGGIQNQTLTDLINRTYQLGLTYMNPHSRWVAGLGRLYLPWAVSLSTIDGGYSGLRFGRKVTVGIFGGTTPDPSAWNYNPDRQIGGTFLNYETGSFQSLRFTGTAGVGLTRIAWKREREFAFTETGLFYKRFLSIYHSSQEDMVPPDLAASAIGTGAPPPAATTSSRNPGLTQSFLTVRMQPHPRVEFDFNDNYFRNPPTFDPRLIGTGLVEKFLFQGFSGGVRFELPYHLAIYTDLGKSSRTNDPSPALNQLYGISLGSLWHTGIRADVHYSKFDSSFGKGHYQAFSLSRHFKDVLQVEVQGGQQDFVSFLTQQNRTRWIYANADWFVSRHYWLGGGATVYRGGAVPYNQFFITSGFRF